MTLCCSVCVTLAPLHFHQPFDLREEQRKSFLRFVSFVNATFHLAKDGGPGHCLFVCLVVNRYIYVLSPSALRPKRKCVHHVRRRSTRWRDWLPTTWSSIHHASAASTATPNSGDYIWVTVFPCVYLTFFFSWLLLFVYNCLISPLLAALAPSQLFKENFTVNPTISSCSKAKATTTRASDANSTKSSGPPRIQII